MNDREYSHPPIPPLWIMIAGPYSSGGASVAERRDNLRAMNEAALAVFRKGHVPVIGVNLALPVIEVGGNDTYDEIMMPLSLAAAARCDAVLRIGGPSVGADQEVEHVFAAGGVVYRDIADVPDAGRTPFIEPQAGDRRGPFVRAIRSGDIAPLVEAFADTPWADRGVEYIEDLLSRHERGERVVLVGGLGSRTVGHLSLDWSSGYERFRASGTPEIVDLVVAPDARRSGVGTRLLDAAEALACERAAVVGIAMGLHSGYGAAQRLYAKRGYVPDGQGVCVDGRQTPEGATIRLDDAPVLYLTKALAARDAR